MWHFQSYPRGWLSAPVNQFSTSAWSWVSCAGLNSTCSFSHITGIWSKLVFQDLSKGFLVSMEREREEFPRRTLPFPEIGVNQVSWSGHWRCEEGTRVSWGHHAPSCHHKYLHLFRAPISLLKLDSRSLSPLCVPMQGNKECRLRFPFFSPRSGFF